jgi:hypothetical protein
VTAKEETKIRKRMMSLSGECHAGKKTEKLRRKLEEDQEWSSEEEHTEDA